MHWVYYYITGRDILITQLFSSLSLCLSVCLCVCLCVYLSLSSASCMQYCRCRQTSSSSTSWWRGLWLKSFAIPSTSSAFWVMSRTFSSGAGWFFCLFFWCGFCFVCCFWCGLCFALFFTWQRLYGRFWQEGVLVCAHCGIALTVKWSCTMTDYTNIL